MGGYMGGDSEQSEGKRRSVGRKERNKEKAGL